MTAPTRPHLRVVSDLAPVASSLADVNAQHLRAFIERIERLEEEKQAIADDIKDLYAEAKANGFDAKILRKIIAGRREDSDQRREEAEILDLYQSALKRAANTEAPR